MRTVIALNDGGGNPRKLIAKAERAVDEAERDLIESALRLAPKMKSGRPNLTAAAELAKISRPTFLAKAREHNLWPWRAKA